MKCQIFPFSARNELRLLFPLVDREHTKVYNNKKHVSVIQGDIHKAYDEYQETNSKQEVQN